MANKVKEEDVAEDKGGTEVRVQEEWGSRLSTRRGWTG